MIERIKVAIFDFDGTLAIHKSNVFTGEDSYYKNAYLYPNIFFREIEPCSILPEVKELIEYLKKQGTLIYCLSGIPMSFLVNAKEKFVHDNYGQDIEFLFCKSQEKKVDVVRILQSIIGCNDEEILFVDDLQSVVDIMKQNKYVGVNVKDISVLLKKLKSL